MAHTDYTLDIRCTNVYALAMPKDPRVMLATRISPAADEWITERAAATGMTRADVVRAMLSVATKHITEVDERLRGLNGAERVDNPPTTSK